VSGVKAAAEVARTEPDCADIWGTGIIAGLPDIARTDPVPITVNPDIAVARIGSYGSGVRVHGRRRCIVVAVGGTKSDTEEHSRTGEQRSAGQKEKR
jgi:hypothetical protein